MNEKIKSLTGKAMVEMTKMILKRTNVLGERLRGTVFEELKQKKWYQKWWGVLILGIIGSAVVGALFYFL